MTDLLDLVPALAGTSPAFSLTVHGTPAPQGSKSYKGHRRSRTTGRRVAVLVESSAKVGPWRDAVHAAAVQALADHDAWIPLDGPLACAMHFTLRKPVSAPKRRRTWPTTYPDLSKLVRSTEDALTTAGVWADDARVIGSLARKFYPGEGDHALEQPGVRLDVWSLT